MFHPKVIYTDETENRNLSMIKYISHRVLHNNKNFLAAVVGPTGSGKTYTGGSIGEMYSAYTGIPFNAQHHVVFNFSELMNLINNGEAENKIQVGSLILFDEPQVSVNVRTWQSQANISFNSLISTFRHRRLVVLFCVPYLEFLDKQTRVLFHAQLEMISIDKGRNIAKVKPFFLEYKPKFDKFYYKYLDVVYKDKGKENYSAHNLGLWEVPKPSDAWIDVYEKKKSDFTTKLNLKLAKKFNEIDNDGKKETDGAQLARILPELINQHGENIIKIAEITQKSPEAIARMMYFLRKSINAEKKRTSLREVHLDAS